MPRVETRGKWNKKKEIKEIKGRSFLGRPQWSDEFSIPNDVNIGTNIDKMYQ